MRFEELSKREQEHLRPMWVETDKWFLCKSDDGGFLPMNFETQVMMIIEDPEVGDYVKQKMLEAGVQVLDDPPWCKDVPPTGE